MAATVVVLSLLDLLNTTTNVTKIQNLLELAANEKITFVPIKMEMINQIYYRNLNIDSFVGRSYDGTTDDKRALRSFIGSTFQFVKNILPGRSHIIIYCSVDYLESGKMMQTLVEGLQLHSEVTLVTDGIFVDILSKK